MIMKFALGLPLYGHSLHGQHFTYQPYTKNHPPFEDTTVPVTLRSFIRYRYASATSSGPGTIPVGSLAAWTQESWSAIVSIRKDLHLIENTTDNEVQ